MGTPTPCACGHETPDVHHVLWPCERSQPPPHYLAYRKYLAPASSVAHILPKFPESQEIAHWKASCLWAGKVLLSKHDTPPKEREDRDSDKKGHELALSQC